MGRGTCGPAGSGTDCRMLFLLLCSISAVLISCDLIAPAGRDPYLTEVFEYVYGPGQHAGIVTPEDRERILGSSDSYVQLGGWGGYIIAGFDHPVEDQHERFSGYDLAVYAQGGVGNEPGVVQVMEDTNGNGLPDDIWYTIAGSVYETEGYVQEYTVTYYRPEPESPISWTDDRGGSGVLLDGYQGDSSLWWWEYEQRVPGSASSVQVGTDPEGQIYCSFSGVLLPDARYQATPDGNWVDIPDRYTNGYAEVYDAQDSFMLPFGTARKRANIFDISDAVADDGGSAGISSITFLRIQTGVFQQTGWLNEVSTEICGAADLSLLPGIGELEL
ncbi:MAG: hypothetical protein K9M84_06170 [Spirochaetia bacterium]|nr:hypothetical protein [Spirochaetia bacterium]MCF7941176.1 hypothetical protein [Spirochaetia bacterium]